MPVRSAFVRLIVRSIKLFKSEKIETLENLDTPVGKETF